MQFNPNFIIVKLWHGKCTLAVPFEKTSIVASANIRVKPGNGTTATHSLTPLHSEARDEDMSLKFLTTSSKANQIGRKRWSGLDYIEFAVLPSPVVSHACTGLP